jgi:glycosyltransferase involved in cell wall biosynthesis
LFSYKKAETIICISNYTKKRVLEYKKLKNIKVIPNGVGKMFGKINGGKKESIIMGLGGLKNRKGFHITLKALSLVKKQIPDIKYFIVGNQNDLEYFSFLKKIVLDLKLEEDVISLGNANDDEVKKLYEKSKIFVLNPISDKYNFEGFGLVYLEANSYGLPVVGSYGNGGEDAIKNGYNGYLAKVNDVEDTAEKILQILEDEKLYRKMSKNAIEWSNSLKWRKVFKKYLNIYEK